MIVHEFFEYFKCLEMWKALLWVVVLMFWIKLGVDLLANLVGIFIALVHVAVFIFTCIFSKKNRDLLKQGRYR